jgi:xanthine dehydrogenase accessory factor
MDPLNLKKLNAAKRARTAAVLVTDIGDGRDRLVLESDVPAGELGDAIRSALKSGKSGLVTVGADRFFLNVHVPLPRMVIIGAVHISQALAPIAQMTGFDVTVIDPRTAFASLERFGAFALRAEWPQDVLSAEPLDRYTALVAVTHDPKIDDFPLRAALDADCFYVGALGSRKTHATRLVRLETAGISADRLSRIHAPIGLDIGAASPEEIAVAIMAQVIEALRRREQGGAAA